MSIPLRSVDDLRRMSTAYRQTLILLAAHHLGIFAFLDRPNGATAEELSAEAGYALRGVQILLDALVGLGLLEKQGNIYNNSPLATAVLIPGQPGYLGNILEHNFHLMARWLHLPDVVRSGEPAPRLSKSQTFRAFILGMGELAKDGAKALLHIYSFRGVRTLLDLGGGPGIYTAEICTAYPDIVGTVFDLPETRPLAETTFARYGLTKRLRFIGGNYLKDDYGGLYDTILVSSVIHSLSEPQIQQLLSRCSAALVPGGHVLIRDFFLDDTRTQPVSNALFAVNMLVATDSGRCYTWSEVAKWVQQAGLEPVQQQWLDSPPRAGLLVGLKP